MTGVELSSDFKIAVKAVQTATVLHFGVEAYSALRSNEDKFVPGTINLSTPFHITSVAIVDRMTTKATISAFAFTKKPLPAIAIGKTRGPPQEAQ